MLACCLSAASRCRAACRSAASSSTLLQSGSSISMCVGAGDAAGTVAVANEEEEGEGPGWW